MQTYLGDNFETITNNVVNGIRQLTATTATTTDSNNSSNNNTSSSALTADAQLATTLNVGDNSDDDGTMPPIVFQHFNQDNTSLAVVTQTGFRLFHLKSTECLTTSHKEDQLEVALLEPLFKSQLVAMVLAKTPEKLHLYSLRKRCDIKTFIFNGPIKSVRQNRKRLVACLEDMLIIIDLMKGEIIHMIKDIPNNPTGLCAISPHEGNNFVAYPGHCSVGEIQVFDAINLSSKLTLSAHASPVVAMTFSPCGLLLATASERGTVLRVFSVADDEADADGRKVYELRRGLKRTVNICNLTFSPNGLYLACSSNTETVHVFRLHEDRLRSSAAATAATSSSATAPAGNNSPPMSSTGHSPSSPVSSSPSSSSLTSSPTDSSWMGYINSMVTASASYLPTQVSDTLLQERAFATVHHHQPGTKNICALSVIHNRLRLLLASEDGYLYIYDINFEEGGDCSLLKQFKLVDCGGGSSSDVGGAEAVKGAGAAAIGEEDRRKMKESSYADQVKNRTLNSDLTESEKFHEMAAALETPPKQCFLLDDDGEFPPMVPTVE